MNRKTALAVILSLLLCGQHSVPLAAQFTEFDRANVQRFVRNMERKHGIPARELRSVFQRAKLQPSILDAIAKPAEAKPWYQYRNIFLTQTRIDGGIAFWRDNASSLDAAAHKFGVDPEYIVAIIGVETSYGRNAGKYRVIDALSTLAFNYPKRSAFFTGELENFLLLTRAQHFDPFALYGSYAGAMGMPQFMPSSYRTFAVDFDNDTTTDIWGNAQDAIGSVGNYLQRNGWVAGGPIATSAKVSGNGYLGLLSAGVKPSMSLQKAASLGVEAQSPPTDDSKAALIELQAEYATEYWLTFNNFYVITRYNTSPLYAMAVFQLGQALRAAYSQAGLN
ncbi:MAG: lytic murein transglycosylase B [Gammaproteobacteria bacterium]